MAVGKLSGRVSYPTPFAEKESTMFSSSLTANLNKVTIETFYNQAENQNEDSSRNFHNTITVDKMGQDITSSCDLTGIGQLHYGGAWRREQAESSRFSRQAENWLSLFGVLTRTFSSYPLTITLGLRGNIYSDFDDSLNPELKLSWRRKIGTVALTYSRVNNIPSMYQRYDETTTKLPNPGLQPETADNFNLSFFFNGSERLSSGISFYYNILNDRITYVWRDTGKGSYENFGKVTYKGVDLNLQFKILQNLSLKTTYTYLKAINEENGLWMTAKPRHRVYVDLSWIPLPEISLIYNLRYESKQYTRSDNKESVSGRSISDLRFEYRPAWATGKFAAFEFFSELKNIFDKEYLYGDGSLAPPFTWMSGLNLKF